jgi:transglutaminase-like putative cysteine protease
MLGIFAASWLAFGHPVRGQESWDAIYVKGSKVGWVHTFVEKVSEKGKDYLRVRVEIEQRLNRGSSVALTRLHYGTIETLDGQVLKLDTLTETGDDNLRAHGHVIRGKMKLKLESSGGRQELTIPWGSDVRGPYAPEQSMAKKPMKEDEKRSLRMFMPVLNKICDIELQARKIEPVVMGDGTKRDLLRIDQTVSYGGKVHPEFAIQLWADSEGQILKQFQDLLQGFVQYRTTEKAAKAEGGPVELDLNKDTIAKVTHKIPEPDKTRQVAYRIKIKDDDAGQVIPADSRQKVQPGEDKSTVTLAITSMGPLDGEAGPEEPGPEYLKANALVTSGDQRVRSLAQRATRGATDPWEKAKRINEAVFQYVQNKNFSVAFASASEVARNRTGDCSEHAVLAAAMHRAAGIPSRVVVGLIYVDKEMGFGYHMWNEVYINRRWVALDSSWNETEVDAVHIKIGETSLDGVSPFEAFLPVARVMGKIEIEPIEIR